MTRAYAILMCCLFVSCTNRVNVTKANNYNPAIAEMFIAGLKTRYVNYRIDSQVKRPINFIKLYLNTCCKDCPNRHEKYSIMQTCDAYAYDTTSNQTNNIFYSELIYFTDTTDIDSVIGKIEKNNCIDAYNLQLQRIYWITSTTLLFANFYPTFDIVGFEDFLKSKYSSRLTIKVINTSR